MKTKHSAARVRRPSPKVRLSGFLLLALLVPIAAHAQGSSPFDSGLTAMQTLFTGTIAKVSSLIAIVIGGYRFVLPCVFPLLFRHRFGDNSGALRHGALLLWLRHPTGHGCPKTNF